jgi:hypothetical protein
MPSKSRRAASRQASLRNRRKRGKSAPQAFQAGPTQSSQPDEESAAEAADQPGPAPQPASAARPGRRPSRAEQAAAAEGAQGHRYLGAELRRIGIVTAVIVALLAVASVVLGG